MVDFCCKYCREKCATHHHPCLLVLQGKVVDSLVDLAEKQEKEQAATTTQIEEMREEIRNHVASARTELQNSIKWLGEHAQSRKNGGGNSSSSDTGGTGGSRGVGASTRR